MPPKRPLTERFWEKVDKNGPTHPAIGTQCWTWTAARMPRGYGSIGGRGSERWYAHRLSWTLHFGAIPEGLWVLHRCDNPPCVNPAHLFLGTHDENMADMHAKGRANPPNRSKTHCKRGHELTPENTRVADDGHRGCIACERAKSRDHYERHRAKVLASGAERYRKKMATDPDEYRRNAAASMRLHRARKKAAATHSQSSVP